MILSELHIANYKNIKDQQFNFSSKINCFIGKNGMGKTNILDAIHYLSFLKSNNISQDKFIVCHNSDFFTLNGKYNDFSNNTLDVFCGYSLEKRKKSIVVDSKRITKFSDYIGTIPLVMISPSDSMLIIGGSEERRKFMDSLISQYDHQYMHALIRYERLLKQRNSLLKVDGPLDDQTLEIIEEMMEEEALIIYNKRSEFTRQFTPVFRKLYANLTDSNIETVDIFYATQFNESIALRTQLFQNRNKEQILGYTLHGPHKDDLDFIFNNYSIKKEGSQGQTKTYFIALKLAQFVFLKNRIEEGERILTNHMPLLLLDDIFDKLDNGRVAQIINYLCNSEFGQIFITDTSKKNITDLLSQQENSDYHLYEIQNGTATIVNTTSI